MAWRASPIQRLTRRSLPQQQQQQQQQQQVRRGFPVFRVTDDTSVLEALPELASEYAAAARSDFGDVQVVASLRKCLKELMEKALKTHEKARRNSTPPLSNRPGTWFSRRNSGFDSRRSGMKNHFGRFRHRYPFPEEPQIPDDADLCLLASFYSARFGEDAFPFAVLLRTASASRWDELLKSTMERELCSRSFEHLTAALLTNKGVSATLHFFRRRSGLVPWSTFKLMLDVAIEKRDENLVCDVVADLRKRHLLHELDMETVTGVLNTLGEARGRWAFASLVSRLAHIDRCEWSHAVFGALARGALVVRDADVLLDVLQTWKERPAPAQGDAAALADYEFAAKMFGRSLVLMRLLREYRQLLGGPGRFSEDAPADIRAFHLTLEAHDGDLDTFIELLRAFDRDYPVAEMPQRDAAVLMAFGRHQQLHQEAPQEALRRCMTKPRLSSKFVYAGTAVMGLANGGCVDEALELARIGRARTAKAAAAFVCLQHGLADKVEAMLDKELNKVDKMKAGEVALVVRPPLFAIAMLAKMEVGADVDEVEAVYKRMQSVGLAPSMSCRFVVMAANAAAGRVDRCRMLRRQVADLRENLPTLLKPRDDVILSQTDLLDGFRVEDLQLLQGRLDKKTLLAALHQGERGGGGEAALRQLVVLYADDDAVQAEGRRWLQRHVEEATRDILTCFLAAPDDA